jgi:hypothetical protein
MSTASPRFTRTSARGHASDLNDPLPPNLRSP